MKYCYQEELYNSELFINDQWVPGPDIDHISDREQFYNCAAHLKGHNITFLSLDDIEFYDWNAGSWSSANQTQQLYGGRGWSCSFHENSTHSWVIMAGGLEGKDRSQILYLEDYLASGDVEDIGVWQEGPALPAGNMMDASSAILDDGSMIMCSGRVQKKVK